MTDDNTRVDTKVLRARADDVEGVDTYYGYGKTEAAADALRAAADEIDALRAVVQEGTTR